ncbi:sulfotransferase family protein [Microbacterium thalassium]|uniref:Sulfotransferase n=1 Tax=Microbacterium thalassium TaxID=362649 RepID=A0A7X0FP04_9MICO|nr:sulfotransferase [Microbacterium thalassium]MBB6391048.1 hypothetical protein [Microbacterium thalassium]
MREPRVRARTSVARNPRQIGEHSVMTTSPVFVVGAPRSGTTLVSAAIAAHPAFHGGPESDFFFRLGAQARADAATDPAWPTKAVELLGSLSRHGERVIDMFGVSTDDLTRYLEQRQPSQSAMLAALFESSLQGDQGPPRWVEKTPNHLWYLREIVDHFPDATIVHVVRDPRDVVRSLVGLPWATGSRVADAWQWLLDHAEIARAREEDPAVEAAIIDVRFEDFLIDPTSALTTICDAAGAEFHPDMLAPERAAEGMILSAEWWKKKNASGIDPARAFAWRRDADEMDDAIATMCDAVIRQFGYDPAGNPISTRMPLACASHRHAALLEPTLLRAAEAGTSIYPAPRDQAGTVWVWSEREAWQEGLTGTARGVMRTRISRALALRPTRTLHRADDFGPARVAQ